MRVFTADIAGHPPVDVAVRDDVNKFAQAVFQGTDHVDLIFNNAGVMPMSALVTTSNEAWGHVLSVNLLGVMNVVCAFVPFLRSQLGSSRIVNIASLAGIAPPTGGRCGAYAATKSAVISVSETLADELRPDGISLSVACPGGVATGILPDGVSPTGLMAPSVAAERILDGVDGERFYIFTHTDGTARERLFRRWGVLEADFEAATSRQ